MIYFIQSGEDGPIKIGFASTAKHAQKRLALFQTGHPWKLRLLKAIPGDKETEAMLHRRFSAHRTHGEWFAPVRDIYALIENPGPCVEHVEQEERWRADDIIDKNGCLTDRGRIYLMALEARVLDCGADDLSFVAATMWGDWFGAARAA